jgi:gliding motility-associated-like protein
MGEKSNISEWEKGLRQDFSGFEPVLPEDVWSSIDVQLDEINRALDFDRQMREEMDSLTQEAPAEVWGHVSRNIPKKASPLSANIWKLAAAGIVVSAIVYYTAGRKEQAMEAVPEAKYEQVEEAGAVVKKAQAGDSYTGIGSAEHAGQQEEPKVSGNSAEPSRQVRKHVFPEKEMLLPEDRKHDSPERSLPENVYKQQVPVHQKNGIHPPLSGTFHNGLFLFANDNDTQLCVGQTLNIFLPEKAYEKAEMWIDGLLVMAVYAPADKIQWSFDEEGAPVLLLRLYSKEGTRDYTKRIRVHPLPEIAIAVSEPGEGKYIFEAVPGSGLLHSWKIDGSPAGRGEKTEKTFYDQSAAAHRVVCLATSRHGCVDSAVKDITNSFVVRVSPPDMPNVFTPNGDGLNDDFKVRIDGHTHFELRIFSLHNELVFEASDPASGWNGINRFSGEKCPEGTYICILRYALAGGAVQEKMQKIDLILR